ncbi:MAG: helix-turn-helix domain-containing protein [Gudongella sp.]|nr:helix-turn-helix domain-containing protein [Gudongella sp.]
MSDFGSRLKNIRKTRNITQKDLAKSIQVAQSTIANYENNIRFPGSEILKQISDYLKISVDYLLGLKEAEKTEDVNNEYNLDTVYLYLIDILMAGEAEEAKRIIKNFTYSGTSSIDIIEYIFIPLLKLIGDKWERDQISIAQEHYMTGLVDRLFDFISENQIVDQTKDLTVLFMAPTGEEHVISLKMSTEYFRINGWKIIFIGRTIPIKSLLDTIKENRVDLLVLSALSQSSINGASYLVEAIKSNLQDNKPKFLLGGNIGDSSNQKTINNFIDYYIPSLSILSGSIKKIENDILNRR